MIQLSLPIETARLVLKPSATSLDDMNAHLVVTAKESGDIFGYAELAVNAIDDIELHCSILPEYQSQGYGTEACIALCEQALAIVDFITATTRPADIAARIILKKLGMVMIGRTGHGTEAHEYWSLTRNDFLVAKCVPRQTGAQFLQPVKIAA